MKKLLFATALLALAPLMAAAARPLPPTPIAAPAAMGSTSTTTHSASLSWLASTSSTTAVPGTVTVLRSSGNCGGGTFSAISTTAAAGGPYTDTSVTGGTTYCYEVEAVIGGVASAPSNSVSVSIPVFAPTSLDVVQGSTLSQATVSWTASLDSGTTVTVKRATGLCSATSLSFAVLTSTAAAAGPYTDTTVAAGQTYCYELIASTGGVASSTSATFQFSSGIASPGSLTVVAN